MISPGTAEQNALRKARKELELFLPQHYSLQPIEPGWIDIDTTLGEVYRRPPRKRPTFFGRALAGLLRSSETLNVQSRSGAVGEFPEGKKYDRSAPPRLRITDTLYIANLKELPDGTIPLCTVRHTSVEFNWHFFPAVHDYATRIGTAFGFVDMLGSSEEPIHLGRRNISAPVDAGRHNDAFFESNDIDPRDTLAALRFAVEYSQRPNLPECELPPFD